MNDKIEPALTAEEWATRSIRRPGLWEDGGQSARIEDSELRVDQSSWWLSADLSALIALANHALPDDDHRKITRFQVELARGMAEYLESGSYKRLDAIGITRFNTQPAAALRSLADALESYLSPK